jgi:hypothetical protein
VFVTACDGDMSLFGRLLELKQEEASSSFKQQSIRGRKTFKEQSVSPAEQEE